MRKTKLVTRNDGETSKEQMELENVLADIFDEMDPDRKLSFRERMIIAVSEQIGPIIGGGFILLACHVLKAMFAEGITVNVNSNDNTLIEVYNNKEEGEI